jgi:HSP20 family protein
MKKIVYLMIFVLMLFNGGILSAVADSTANDPAYNQAKQNYRTYLEQLKVLREQYRQITSEVQKIVAEEGVPTWDDKSDQLKMTNPLSSVQATLTPTVFGDADIKETEKDMIVKMDIPGVSKDQLKIKLEDDQILKVSGSREVDKEEQKTTQDGQYSKIERQHGAFERSIKLPVPAQESGIQARYDNGVLTVTIPKAKEAKKEVAVSIQ